jgi:hypothetical protein
MAKIGIVALLVLMVGRVYAQQEYFVLIQAANDQPFYARVGAKTISASAQGHLIIPQLKDSLYHITIGFPKKLFPEQQFSITINKKDQEFQLKNLGEKEWGLVNPHTMEIKTPENKDTDEGRTHPEGVKKDDAFSRLMAGVVSDTAVMYNTYVGEESPGNILVRKESLKEDSVVIPLAKPTGIAGTAVSAGSAGPSGAVGPGGAAGPAGKDVSKNIPSSANPEPVAVAESPENPHSQKKSASPKARDPKKPAAAINPDKAGLVEKIGEQRTSSAVQLSYIDFGKGGRRDTIEVIIPVDSAAQSSPDLSAALGGGGTEPGAVAPGSNTASPADSAGGAGVGATGKAKKVLINSDCRNFATDYDVDRLRVRMLSVSRDDDKMLAAKRAFKMKCFSTRQIRAICEVFPEDEGKFRLFEAAYPSVSDNEHFRELSAQFIDESYIKRFKTMVGAE